MGLPGRGGYAIIRLYSYKAGFVGVKGLEGRGVCLAVCSVKGGTGKTTLSFNLAERAGAYGLRPALVDCDEQEASMAFHQMGGEERRWPAFRGAVSQAGLQRVASLCAGGEYDLVVCDMPGRDNMLLSRFLAEMDMVLSPVGVGPADLSSACGFLFSLQMTEVNLVFVPNGIAPGRARLAELRETLEGRGGRVCPVALRRLVAHMDALRSGLGVCEYAPGSAAAAEVEALWQWLLLEVPGLGLAESQESG